MTLSKITQMLTKLANKINRTLIPQADSNLTQEEAECRHSTVVDLLRLKG